MKKNPIIFIAMLIALAFTSCQMNTDDSVVTPPAPTYKITVTATNGTVTLSKTEAKAGETITVTKTNPESGYEFDLGKVTIKDANGNALSVDATTKSFVMPASNVTITVEFVKITDGNPTTPTDSTQWNLVASVIKHENGVGKNDGAFHGTITLNKAKANTGDTVTITVTPDSGYEVGSLSAKGLNGKELEITTVETNKTYTFTVPAYATTVTARFDPVDGYNVTITDNGFSALKAYSTGEGLFKPGTDAYFYINKDYFKNSWYSYGLNIKIDGNFLNNGSAYTKTLNGNYYKVFFTMPIHDVIVEAVNANQQ